MTPQKTANNKMIVLQLAYFKLELTLLLWSIYNVYFPVHVTIVIKWKGCIGAYEWLWSHTARNQFYFDNKNYSTQN